MVSAFPLAHLASRSHRLVQHGFQTSRGLHYARMSETFQPCIMSSDHQKAEEKKQGTMVSKSQKLLLETGMIYPAYSPGTFNLLPLFMRSLEKLIRIIDDEMRAIGCQKLWMPCIQDASIWNTSGRWRTFGGEMFRLKDRMGRDLCLGPTHEECITSLVASTLHQPSHKRFPLRLYQITTKFRDEMKPKHGVLRAREFLMKDLYTFDSSEAAARESYIAVCSAYERILKTLDLQYIKASASTGAMGGSESHEYLLPCESVGEDLLWICQRCNTACNQEIFSEITDHNSVKCPMCSIENSFNKTHGMEVAHAFLLGDRYSKAFKANFINPDGKPQPLVMGCFGIGVTRLVASAVECLSSEEEIRWPQRIAPYKVCVISPKAGSKEAVAIGPLTQILCDTLSEIPEITNDIVWDDRDEFSIGRRLNEANKAGYPVIVVVGKEAVAQQPKFEVHCGHDPRQRFSFLLQELTSFLRYSNDLVNHAAADRAKESMNFSKIR